MERAAPGGDRAAIRRLCGWAVERGLISASPCAGIRAPAAEVARDRVFLTDDELAAVWQGAEGIGWPFGPVVQLLFLTGQRRSEVAGMRWAEIDLEAKLWTLPKERSKNGLAHVIPLSYAAIAICRGSRALAVMSRAPVDGFGATKVRLDGHLPGSIAAWRLHDLRRTFASGAARLTFRGIVSVYQKHDFASEQRAAVEAWARHVEGLAGMKADQMERTFGASPGTCRLARRSVLAQS